MTKKDETAPAPPADDIETAGVGFHLEDFRVGRRFKTVGRTVTEGDIGNFVSLTGMLEVIFTNTEYIAQHSAMGGRVAPAALVYAFAEGLLIQASLQTTGMAFLDMELQVEAPVFAGDTIHVVCEVTEARATSKPGRGIVKTRNSIVNQRGEVVIVYTPVRMIKARAK
jgi:acyl dehydratase